MADKFDSKMSKAKKTLEEKSVFIKLNLNFVDFRFWCVFRENFLQSNWKKWSKLTFLEWFGQQGSICEQYVKIFDSKLENDEPSLKKINK